MVTQNHIVQKCNVILEIKKIVYQYSPIPETNDWYELDDFNSSKLCNTVHMWRFWN